MFVFKKSYECLLNELEDLKIENEELQEENDKLTRDLKISANANYIHDSKRYAAAWHDLNIKVGQMERDHLKEIAQLEKMIQQKNMRIESLENDLKIARNAVESIPSNKRKRDKYGRYLPSETDNKDKNCMSKKEKKKQAYLWREEYSMAEIGRKLGITAETAAKYVAEFEKEWEQYKMLGVSKSDETEDYIQRYMRYS